MRKKFQTSIVTIVSWLSEKKKSHFNLLKEIKYSITTYSKTFTNMAGLNLNNLEAGEIKKIVDSFDAVITDCDGVLWNYDDVVIPDAANVMNAFKNAGKKIYYFTNHGRHSQDEYIKKCHSLNFPADNDNFFCPTYLAVRHLVDCKFDKKVYVVGSKAITDQLDKVGIAHCGSGPDPFIDEIKPQSFNLDSEVGAVIVAFDSHFSYVKMVKAANYLRDENSHFIGINDYEMFYNAEHNWVQPCTGSFVRSIEACSGKKATIVCKPSPYIGKVLINQHKLDPKRTLMIGDTPRTDVLFGKNCGFKTLLVLSGFTSPDDINNWKNLTSSEEKEFIPDYYVQTIGDLLPHIK